MSRREYPLIPQATADRRRRRLERLAVTVGGVAAVVALALVARHL